VEALRGVAAAREARAARAMANFMFAVCFLERRKM
jgi:hypothetical protein